MSVSNAKKCDCVVKAEHGSTGHQYTPKLQDGHEKPDAYLCAYHPSHLLCQMPKLSALWAKGSEAQEKEGKKVKTSKYGEVEVISLAKMDEHLAKPEFQKQEPPKELILSIMFNVAFYGNWFPEELKTEFDQAHKRLEKQGAKPGAYLMALEATFSPSPNEQRFVEWITDRMNSWNQAASKTSYARLEMKENLIQALVTTDRWYAKLSPQAHKKIRALYSRTYKIINRKEFEWEKDFSGGLGALAVIGRASERWTIGALVIKFGGGAEKTFRFSPDLFKKDRNPKETLKTIESSGILYDPIPVEWQKPVWNFFTNHYDQLYKERKYWRALEDFVTNNPDYISAFIEEKDRWTSKLPERRGGGYAHDAADTYDLHCILKSLAEQSKIPEEHKLTVYHYILSTFDRDKKKNYQSIHDVKFLEERVMSDYLVEHTEERPECYSTSCNLGGSLFIKRAKEWGAEKTIGFMKRVIPEVIHDRLGLSFRIVKLLIDLDREEINKFLDELRDPKKRDVEAINSDPLWHEMWSWLLGFLSASSFMYRYSSEKKYGASLNDLPLLLLRRGKKHLAEEFYFKNHPYAKLYNMARDIRPSGKGLSFVSIDSFADPKRVAHADKDQVYPLNGLTTQWKEVHEESMATHGVSTSTLAVGDRYGLAPDAELYVAPVDFGSESLPATLIRTLEEVIERREGDSSIAVVGMSFGLSVPHVFRKVAKKSPLFERLKKAAERLHAMGVALVAASGNDGSDDLVNMVGYLPHVQLVGATDSRLTEDRGDDWRAFYTTGGDKENPVRFFAHAQPVLIPENEKDLNWERLTGTSYAQPHFSGVLLLMKEVNPELSWDEHYKVLEQTRDKGSSKSKRGSPIKPVWTIDPMEAIAVVAQRPGSRYKGERLKRLLKHLGYSK